MRYEMITLSVKIGGAGATLAGVKADSDRADFRGRLLGAWTSEIGDLNRVLVLRAFADEAALHAERERLQADVNPFGAGEAIAALTCEAYAPFPWCPPPAPGAYGGVYEIRTYRLKPGGLAPTVAAWEAACPARNRFSPLLLVMHALDGCSRFTHIWPFTDLNARAKARAESVAAGVWPPKDGPKWLTGDMRSLIALPAPFSPLR